MINDKTERCWICGRKKNQLLKIFGDNDSKSKLFITYVMSDVNIDVCICVVCQAFIHKIFNETIIAGVRGVVKGLEKGLEQAEKRMKD